MKKNRAFLLTFLFIAVACLYGQPVYADRIPVDEVEIITPAYSPEPGTFEPRFGTYAYSVSWQGIPAGTVELEMVQNGTDYRIKGRAETNRFVSLFYKLRFNTEALVSASTLQPKRSVYRNRTNNDTEHTKIEFLPDGKIKSVHEDRRGDIEELHFSPNNFTLDPFSAVFLALSLPWEVGDNRQFDTFTGTSRYLVELTAVDKTNLTVKGETREAVVIAPRVKNLTKKDPSEDDDRLREAKIYVSTDPSREILRISSDIFIGSVNTRLVSFTPSNNNAQASIPADAPAPDIQPDLQPTLPPVMSHSRLHPFHPRLPGR